MGSPIHIGKNVKIGEQCQFGEQVVIYDDTVIGDRVQIGDFVVLGRKPVKAKRSQTTSSEELQPLKISNDVLIGSHVILYRGATIAAEVFIADSAQVREKSTIGAQTIVGRSVTVENASYVGARCKLETNVYVTAFSHIEDDCFLAPMVTLTNDPSAGRGKDRKRHIKGPTLRRGARIGANATILPGLVLHEDCLVGAGAVVTRDVAAKEVVVGSPAKRLRDVPESQRLED